MSRLTFSYDSTDVSFNFSTTVNNNGDAEALGMLMNLLGSRINPASAPAPIQTPPEALPPTPIVKLTRPRHVETAQVTRQ